MILVTGSGRSGTSAVARLLHEAGIAVGRHLVAADANNAEGYFEERPLIEINQHILHGAGLGGMSSEASRASLIDAAQPFVDDMLALAADATPAWKDPRFSWTLEPWLGVLAPRPRIIVCLRSPGEVLASTLRYYGQDSAEATDHVMRLWRNQYQRLLAVIGDYRLEAVCVEYEELHGDPARAIAPLVRFVGRDLDSSLVRTDLRHHAADVSPELRELYSCVCSLGRGA
jgi:hypothetical protein